MQLSKKNTSQLNFMNYLPYHSEAVIHPWPQSKCESSKKMNPNNDLILPSYVRTQTFLFISGLPQNFPGA